MMRFKKGTSARVLAVILVLMLVVPAPASAVEAASDGWDRGTGHLSHKPQGDEPQWGEPLWDKSPVPLSQDEPSLPDEPEAAARAENVDTQEQALAPDESGDEDAPALLPVETALAPLTAAAVQAASATQAAQVADAAPAPSATAAQAPSDSDVTPLANSSTVIDFDSASFFTTDVPVGTYANWSYAASSRTITVTNDVSVIGTVSGATQTLTFNIPSGKTVKWGADYEGDTFDTTGLIYLTDAGTFEVTSGSIATSNAMAPRNTIVGNASAVIKVSGGTVSTVAGYAIYTDGDVVVSGGTVSTDSDYAIRSVGNVTVSGGTVSSTRRVPFYVGAGGTLTVSGGIVFACDASTTGSGNIFAGGATFKLNPVVSDNGVVVVLNKSAGTATYIEGTNDGLTVSSGATATWHIDATLGGGISYANGTNTGFFPLPVTVGTPPSITTTTLPAGTVATAYSQTLSATGTTPITWSVSAGNLPDGLTLDGTTGAISGTPTTAGTVSFTVTAANGFTPDATQALSIAVGKGDQAAPTPTALGKTDETAAGTNDGTITGVSAAMEYSSDGGATYTACTTTTLTGLAPETYLVRYAQTVNHNASADTQLVIFGGSTPPPSTWPVLEHFDDFTGSGTSSARVDADHVEFIRLLKDGVEIDSQHYAITSGSTVITFNEAYLKTLANGTHWYVAEYGDFMSSENIRLIVNVASTQNLTSGSNDAALPQTGDTNAPLAWCALLAAALGALFIRARRTARRVKGV